MQLESCLRFKNIISMQYNYSIIIPYRDKYDLFIIAIGSIPDREDIQIIIADNGTEPLPQEQIPSKSKATITYTTSSPTKGAGCARNVGLTKVEGQYIIFLDADDYFTPNAFESFDKYREQEYDIVYFKADSIDLTNGQQSGRHKVINQYVSTYLKDGNEDVLRYKFVNPIAKMLRSEFVLKGGFLFDEIKVSNDAWFSLMTGHYAKKITASEDVVYMITTGEIGSSLTKIRTAENQFIRFTVAVRKCKFVDSVGRKDMRSNLISHIGHALWSFGPKEALKWIRYVHEQGVKLF